MMPFLCFVLMLLTNSSQIAPLIIIGAVQASIHLSIMLKVYFLHCGKKILGCHKGAGTKMHKCLVGHNVFITSDTQRISIPYSLD